MIFGKNHIQVSPQDWVLILVGRKKRITRVIPRQPWTRNQVLWNAFMGPSDWGWRYPKCGGSYTISRRLNGPEDWEKTFSKYKIGQVLSVNKRIQIKIISSETFQIQNIDEFVAKEDGMDLFLPSLFPGINIGVASYRSNFARKWKTVWKKNRWMESYLFEVLP